MAADRICAIVDGIVTLGGTLEGLQSQSEFYKKHYDIVRTELSMATFLFEDAARVAAKIRTIAFWDQDAVEELLATVGRRVSHASSHVHASGRKSMQDYCNFPHHLTEAVWKTLQNKDSSMETKMHCLMKHLTTIGLRCPSEQTYAMVCAVLNSDIQLRVPQERYRLLLAVKPLVKRYCEGTLEVCTFVEKLPEQREVFEQLGFPPMDLVPCQVPWLELVMMAKSIPLRVTNRMSLSSTASSSSTSFPSVVPTAGLDLMGLMHGFVSILQAQATQQQHAAAPRIELLPAGSSRLAQSVSNASRLMDIVNTQSNVEAHSVDVPQVDVPKPVAHALEDAVDKPKTVSPLQAIALLQDKAPVPGAVDVCKRPASSTETLKTVCKRPASDHSKTKQQKKKHAGLKTGAGKKKPSGKETDQPWLPTMKQRLKQRPNGCAKCRNRPGCCPSCWQQRAS